MPPRVSSPSLLLGVFVCLCLVSGVAGGAVAADEPITITQYGSGIALEDESTTYLWQYESYSVTVKYALENESANVVCLRLTEADSISDEFEQPLTCELATPAANGTSSVTLTQGEWPENVTGDQTLAIEIYPDRSAEGEPVETVLLPVHIFEKDGDLAGNGLTNEREIEIGTHPAQADTDGDGLTDGVEVMIGTDPRDQATPYKIGVITIGTVAIGAFATVLLTGRLMVVLRSIRSTMRTDSTAQPSTGRERPTQSFEPPIRDEERVQRLLEDHDGRLKQSQIVDATDWSKSKVSRLLSSMEDDGEITRIRLGRENLVCLRGHEPPDVTPSWED